MMAQKRLDELLKEDQEPFQLKSYIADRRTKLRPTHLQPISQSSRKFCRNACLFSFQGSPDLRKSPAGKSPIFLHIPARTAALLLEAALRIQKRSKAKTHGFGLFGSILKRLTNRGRKKEIQSAKVSVKDLRKSRISDQRDKSVSSPSSCSAIWSETWSSDRDSTASKDIHTIGSPFRFVRPSGHRTPAASPKTEEKDKYDVDKLEDGGAKEEEEQCSPVSVLDAPFQDDQEEEDDSVQRAKQQLLKKLQRFEKLAGLDPIQLDKRMVENDNQDDEIPKHMRLLVSDEEEEVVESWEDVTIDMMVEQDFTREFGEWNRNQQQVKDTAAELELAIFGLLVQELWS